MVEWYKGGLFSFVNKRKIRGGQQFFYKNFSLSRYALQTQNTFDLKPEVQAAD